jgi:hypothetical protein
MRIRHPCDAVRTCPVTLTGPALGREHVVGVCRHYGVPVPPGAWADAFTAVRASPPAAVAAAA